MIKVLLKYSTLLFFIAIGLIAFGQSPNFKNHSIFKGQKGYTVNTVFQDSKGLLWYGTSEGLVRYDGVSYSVFTTEDRLALNFVTSISEDEKHNLWIGHKKGKISILDETYKIHRFNDLDSLLDENISKIKFITDNHFLISTLGGGLIEVKSGKIKIHNSGTGTADDYIYDIEIDNTGKIWLASDIGLICFNLKKDKWDRISMEDGLPDNIIRDIEFDDVGNLWIGMEEAGMAIYNMKNKKIIPISNWEFGSLNHFLIRKKGEIWISTKSQGVVKLNYKSVINYTYKNYLEKDGLISNRTNSLFKDNEGNIWIPSKEGLSQFTGDLFEILNANGGLPSNQIYSFIIDTESRYWVASASGLYVMTKSVTGNFSSQKLLDGDKYASHTYTSVYQSDKNTVWVGTYGYGVYQFNNKTLAFKNYTVKDSLSNNSVISISGNLDKIWFSTSGGGVSYVENKADDIQFSSYTKADGLGSNYIYYAYKDSKERTWFAKEGGGISLLEKGSLKSIESFDTLSNVVYGIAEDGLNNIWFTTANEGLIKYDGKEYHHYTTKDGLITNSFNSITTDNYGNCVLASNEGITVIDVEKEQFVNYREGDGVAYLQPNLNGIYKDKKGIIWISTTKGIIKYNHDVAHEVGQGVKIHIKKVKTLDNEITNNTSVLKYNENHLMFSYIGLWYKSPESISYRYKIEGHDVDWIYAQKSLTATYSGLPSGKYVFVVQASTGDDVWNKEQSAYFSFEIATAIWERWWFIALVIALILIGIYLFIKIRVANLKKSEQILKEEVKRRTAEISKQKDELENNKDIIEQKNKDIMDSIHYAKRIQSAILPPDKMVKEFLPDSFILYKPKDIVAGDFYWLECKNNKILFAAADCTGHGVPGAMVSVVCNNALNRSVREHNLDDPGKILDQSREIIIQEFEKSDEEVKDGMDIALCSIEDNPPFKGGGRGMTLKYAGAHNPLWIVRKGELIETKADKQPIGKFDYSKPYTTHDFDLQKGDIIYIFTDGFVDQFGGEKGKKFKTRAFRELVLSIQDKKMDEQKSIIDTVFEEWRGEEEQVDDVCVIGVRI